MSHTLIAIGRASLIIAALSIGSVHAADTAPRRIAPACTGDALGCKPAARHTASRDHVARDTTPAKAPARRPQDSGAVTTSANDGSRFAYDSCGCSND